jgi:transcription termination/antitermination protein NusA
MSELTSAIKQICDEKGLAYDAVIATIESALAAAYRKDFGERNQNIKVEFDPETGKSKVFDIKTVVEDMPEEEETSEGETTEEKKIKPGQKKKEETEIAVEPAKKIESLEAGQAEGEIGAEEEERKFNPKTEIQISEAKKTKKTAKIGDEIKTRLTVPDSYGRMAAQTAKQVIIQRLREAERNMIYNEFKDKEHEVVSGVVQRREGRFVLVDLGRGTSILPIEEQILSERYRPGDRLKVYVKAVNLTSKGPEIVVSRTADEILRKIFYLEIPEISNGLIEIKAVAREAGARSKVAVWTDSDNVDPIGSCVGQRGSRIQTIIGELGGEKVDIIEYDEEPVKFIANALSPARIVNIEIDEAGRKAKVMVAADQFSLAIGKGGQNARLAAKLTGWKIDIVEAKEKKAAKEEAVSEAETAPAATEAEEAEETEAKAEAVNETKEEGTAEESAPSDETKMDNSVNDGEIRNEDPKA